MSGYCPNCGNTICICEEAKMTKKLNIKIIKVESCNDCPYKEDDNWAESRHCTHVGYKKIDNLPFPEWCPLEEGHRGIPK